MIENDPIIPGCPSIFPHELPGGFDGVETGSSVKDYACVLSLADDMARMFLDEHMPDQCEACVEDDPKKNCYSCWLFKFGKLATSYRDARAVSSR